MVCTKSEDLLVGGGTYFFALVSPDIVQELSHVASPEYRQTSSQWYRSRTKENIGN